MDRSRRIVLLTYEGAELLDLSGPASVFAMANRLANRTLYDLVVASPDAPLVGHSCGIALQAVPAGELRCEGRDTVLVIGADRQPLLRAMADTGLRDCLKQAAGVAERIGSVCSGVFVLAAAGLVNGRSVATHWSACAELGSRFPEVNCNADSLYVRDGNVWTSAGVTTGIDMALALLEQDHGSALKAAVARQLVVYSHRPGHQSQFSELLTAQAKEDERFAGLTAWLSQSVASGVSVEQMAQHVGMSPRSFYRHFVRKFGQTPAKFHEAIRLNAARRLLEARSSVAVVANSVGFRSEAAFRTAFKAQFGVTPQLYRETWSAR